MRRNLKLWTSCCRICPSEKFLDADAQCKLTATIYGGNLRYLVTASNKGRRMCKMIWVGGRETWTARKATSLLIHGNSILLHLPVKGLTSLVR